MGRMMKALSESLQRGLPVGSVNNSLPLCCSLWCGIPVRVQMDCIRELASDFELPKLTGTSEGSQVWKQMMQLKKNYHYISLW